MLGFQVQFQLDNKNKLSYLKYWKKIYCDCKKKSFSIFEVLHCACLNILNFFKSCFLTHFIIYFCIF